MSLANTKKHLVELLADPENRVVALSGKWGTGKSHLWRAVRSESTDEKVRSALYVSLFGLSSMDQVKLKIVQSAMPKAGENPSAWDSATRAMGAASKFLQSFHKGFSALNEVALLAVPTILKNRVIVLDDIERKHEKLSVDEVMGFIDEFTQQHGARIVLILNSDQLVDLNVWDTLREKVIDQEVKLQTSPAEAFDIAVEIQPTPYADRIKKTIETCGVTNIRIIRKVIKTVGRILGHRDDLSADVLSRVIPSTVLLSAIYYKGIDDGPDFDFVLAAGTPGSFAPKPSPEPQGEDAKRRAKWRLLLQQIGIHACDEYENLVVEFLAAGLFDAADVERLIDRYASQADVMQARKLADDLQENIVWNYKMSDDTLVAQAAALVPHSSLLNIYTLTSVHEMVSELVDGVVVADAMIDAWIDNFRASPPGVSDFDSAFRRPVHPRIRHELDAAKAAALSATTVFDACSDVVKNSGWGRKQEMVMKAATAADFENVIFSLSIEDLRFFLCRFVEMCVQKESYIAHFGTATDCFTGACRNIVANPDQARLGKLIKMLYKDAGIEAELTASAPAGPLQGSAGAAGK